MSIDYIRRNYRAAAAAKIGGRVEYRGGPAPVLGTIVGTRDARLRIRLDSEKRIGTYHPTWMLRYLDDQASAPQAQGEK
jgi:hypothetical protein